MNKMIIPKIIKIGYQERSGTYTGKLAYVTYVDHKGKHRKEYSWNSWRNSNISPDDYDNDPLSGFVLNKKAGGGSWGWHNRNTYCRVYDPRGFEFEISIENLLFILQECDCIKGKGLEGEFVYAWDGKDLVLLPVSSQEYKSCYNFTNLQAKKVTKNDMVEGCLYKTKKDERVMYLGRHEIYKYSGYYSSHFNEKSHKVHVFRDLDAKESSCFYPKYLFERGFTNLGERLTTEPDTEFVNYYDEFLRSKYPVSDQLQHKLIKSKKQDIDSIKSYGGRTFIYKHEDDTLHFLESNYNYGTWYGESERGYYYKYSCGIKFDHETKKYVIDRHQQPSWFSEKCKEMDKMITDNIYEIILVNEHGAKLDDVRKGDLK